MSRHPFPWDLLFGLTRDLPRGERSLIHDAQVMVARMRPSPTVTGLEHIPEHGGLVLVANHYQRRGLWIAWPAALVTCAVAERRNSSAHLHWLVTGGLRWFQFARRGPEIPFTRPLFQSVARAYGMAALPLSGAAARAAVVRRWLAWAEAGEPVAMFPEGLAGTSSRLVSPEPGFEGLCRLFLRKNIPLLPVGIWEQNEVLHVSFGQTICVNRKTNPRLDQLVMDHIAAIVPEQSRRTSSPGEQSATGAEPEEPLVEVAGRSLE